MVLDVVNVLGILTLIKNLNAIIAILNFALHVAKNITKEDILIVLSAEKVLGEIIL